jgi:hypothetical protein
MTIAEGGVAVQGVLPFGSMPNPKQTLAYMAERALRNALAAVSRPASTPDEILACAKAAGVMLPVFIELSQREPATAVGSIDQDFAGRLALELSKLDTQPDEAGA